MDRGLGADRRSTVAIRRLADWPAGRISKAGLLHRYEKGSEFMKRILFLPYSPPQERNLAT
jgi:hypothetical protein